MSLSFTPDLARHPRSTVQQPVRIDAADARGRLLCAQAVTQGQLLARNLRRAAQQVIPLAATVRTSDPRHRFTSACGHISRQLYALAECVERALDARRSRNSAEADRAYATAGRILARIDQDLAEALAAVEALEILAGATPTPAVPPTPEVTP